MGQTRYAITQFSPCCDQISAKNFEEGGIYFDLHFQEVQSLMAEEG